MARPAVTPRAVLPVLAALACVMACVMAWAPAGRAAEPAVTVVPSSGQAPDVALTAGVAVLDREVRLRNTATGTDGARSFRADAVLRRRDDGLAVPVTWSRLDGGTGAVIAPGASLVLRMTATVPQPGVYDASIDTAIPAAPDRPEQPDRRILVTVTREVAAVPSDLVVAPDPMHQVRWPWQDGHATVLMELRNVTTKPIEFGAPAVLGFGRKAGDATEAVAARRLPSVDASGCASPLQPGARCVLRLRLDGIPEPGQYAVQVGLGGPGGGWSQAPATVWVRRPLTLAVLVTAIGVSCGWLVQAWRASGRRAVAALIRTGALRNRIASLVAGSPGTDLSALARPILDALDALEARCRAGDDPADQVDGIEERVTRLATAASVERVFAKLPPEAKAALGPAHDLFMQNAAAAAAGKPPDGYDDGAAAMVANLNAWQAFTDTRAAAQARRQPLDALLALQPAGEAAVATATEARNLLSAALDAAAAPIPAPIPATAVADRTAALDKAARDADARTAPAIRAYADDLRARLQAVAADDTATADRKKAAADALAGLDGLDRAGGAAAKVRLLGGAWPASRPVAPVGLVSGKALEGRAIDVSAAVQTSLDLPVATAWHLVPGRSLGSLRRQQAWMEWLTNLVVLAGLSLSGAVAVAGDPGWGSPLDLVKLLLLALGSRIVIGELGAATQPAPAAH